MPDIKDPKYDVCRQTAELQQNSCMGFLDQCFEQKDNGVGGSEYHLESSESGRSKGFTFTACKLMSKVLAKKNESPKGMKIETPVKTQPKKTPEKAWPSGTVKKEKKTAAPKPSETKNAGKVEDWHADAEKELSSNFVLVGTKTARFCAVTLDSLHGTTDPNKGRRKLHDKLDKMTSVVAAFGNACDIMETTRNRLAQSIQVYMKAFEEFESSMDNIPLISSGNADCIYYKNMTVGNSLVGYECRFSGKSSCNKAQKAVDAFDKAEAKYKKTRDKIINGFDPRNLDGWSQASENEVDNYLSIRRVFTASDSRDDIDFEEAIDYQLERTNKKPNNLRNRYEAALFIYQADVRLQDELENYTEKDIGIAFRIVMGTHDRSDLLALPKITRDIFIGQKALKLLRK